MNEAVPKNTTIMIIEEQSKKIKQLEQRLAEAEKSFDEWAISEDRSDGLFSNANNYTRDEYFAKAGFLAAAVPRDAEIEKLRKELDEAVKVIEFYGNEYNYSIDSHFGVSGDMTFRCVLHKDMEIRDDHYSFAGKKAREYLTKHKGASE